MANNDELKIIVPVILDDSNIKVEIDEISNKIARSENLRVKLIGEFDVDKTLAPLRSQISNISKDLKLNIKPLDTSEFNTKNVVKDLNSIQTQTSQVTNSLTNLADKFKSPIKPVLDTDGLIDANKTIEKVQQKFAELGTVSVKGSYGDKLGNDQLEKMIVNIKNAQGEVRTLTFQIGTLSDDLFYLTRGTSDNSGIEKLINSTQKAQDKIKALKTSLTSNLQSIRSDWQDVNGGKSVESSENIDKLKGQYLKAAQAIRDLRNADDTTFASMKVNATTQIEKLNQMVSQYHNAEKVATQLRARGFETVKVDTGNNIDKFINSINNSKVPIQAMKTEIDNLTSSFARLDSIEDQAEKSSALTNILNTLDNAKTKFQSLKELFKNSGNVDWLTVNSEQINKIDDMATKIAIYKNNLASTREEWKSQGLYVGEIQEKTVSLARSLSGIKKPEKFNEWVNEWTTLNQKATQLKANLDSQVTIQNRIYEIQTRLTKLDPTKNAEEIALLNSKLQTEQKELSNLQMQSNVYSNLLSFEEQERYITEQTAKVRERLATASAKSNDKTTSQRISELNSYKDSLNDVITKLNILNNSTAFTKNSSTPQVVQIKQQIGQLLTEYQTLANTLQNENFTPADMQSVITKFQQLDMQFKQVSNSAKELKTSISSDNSMQRQAQQVELLVEKVKKLRSEIIAYQNVNSKAMKSNRTSSNGITYSAEIDAMLAKLKNASSVTDDEFKKISASFRSLKADVKSAGLEGGTIFTSLWANMKKFSSWMSMTTIISTFVMDIRNAVTELKKIDTILTEISKTSDLTTEALGKLGKTSFDTASKYGRKASDYLTGVQEMYRAGFQNAPEMSELSTLAQAAGDLTTDAANDYLIATDAAYDFKGSVEKLNAVLDSQNYITNNAAVSMQDMADATSEAASVASQYGIDIDELSALIAVSVSKTRESGSEVGNALKALFINLQDTTSKPIREAFEAVNISMTEMVDGSEKLKTPIELIKELSEAFTNLDKGDPRRANILSDIGGKYHANTLSAILSDIDSYYQMLELYSQGKGSAAEEAQKTAESWEGMFNALENDWTKFVNEFANSDLFKSLIESAQRFIDVLSDASSPLNFILARVADLLGLVTKLSDTIGFIPTIITGLALKNVGEQNLNTPVFVLPQIKSTENATRFKIRLSNCWEMLMAV